MLDITLSIECEIDNSIMTLFKLFVPASFFQCNVIYQGIANFSFCVCVCLPYPSFYRYLSLAIFTAFLVIKIAECDSIEMITLFFSFSSWAEEEQEESITSTVDEDRLEPTSILIMLLGLSFSVCLEYLSLFGA